MSNHQLALVTGATSGIGKEFAARLAAQGCDLVLVARRETELQQVADDLVRAHGCLAEIHVADLTDVDARAGLVARYADRGVDVLVNNAGFGLIGAFVEADRAQTSDMVELNCRALVELAQAFLPGMVARGRGTIINVASTAAFQPLANMAVYAATKAFVLSFTQALSSECRGSGVQVTAICPGPTETAFFEVAGADDVMTQRRTPAQVVDTALRAVARRQAVAVDGPLNAVQATLAKIAPYRAVELVARQMLRRDR